MAVTVLRAVFLCFGAEHEKKDKVPVNGSSNGDDGDDLGLMRTTAFYRTGTKRAHIQYAYQGEAAMIIVVASRNETSPNAHLRPVLAGWRRTLCWCRCGNVCTI